MEWQALLTELIEMIESTSDFLWIVARKQVMVEMVSNFLTSILLFGVFVGSGLWIKKIYQKIKGIDFMDTNPFVITGMILLGIISIIMFFLFPAYLYQGIARLINPDYYAIKALVDLVKTVS